MNCYKSAFRKHTLSFVLSFSTLIFLVVLSPATASAGDCFIAGPYVTHVDQSSARIIWVTPAGTPAGEVRLNDTYGGNVRPFSAELTTPLFQSRDDNDHITELDHVRHDVRLHGLRPYSEYGYQVQCGDGTTTVSGSFRTAPELGSSEPVAFIVVSDGHADSGRFAEVAPAVGKAKPDFVVHTGDLTGGIGPDWHRWLPYFQVARVYHTATVTVPVIGGHDAWPNRNFRAFFGFNDPEGNPADEDDKGTWYTFRYGNVEFFMIDHTTDLESQLGWAEQKLAASDAEWKIVALHQSFANAGSRGNFFRGVFYDFAGLFEQYGVDIVITGHDHVYERNVPIGPDGVKPVHYIAVNSGGNFREVRPTPVVKGGRGLLARMYAHFHVEGNRLVMEARSEYPDAKAGKVLDRLELIKDENGMYQDEIMAEAVDKDLVMEIGHIFTGNLDGDLRYSRRDINAKFDTYPEDNKTVMMTLNVHRFPLGSELIVYEQNDPQRWRTEYQRIEITGDTVSFEVTAPENHGTVSRTWSVDRGTRITEPIPEFLLNISIDGRDFEPALVQPSFGVQMHSRSE